MENKEIKTKIKYIIISYQKDYIDDQETPASKHIFPNLDRKGVVGIMKVIMDNFNPDHVDIMKQEIIENGK